MRTLILSCSAGHGHNSCSAAIQRAFEAHGHTCLIEDSMRFISRRFAKFIDWGHATMYRSVPGLFKFAYGYSDTHENVFREGSLPYRLLTAGSRRMLRYIQDGQFDVVICTHNFPGIMLAHALKKEPMHIHTSMVATDYTCSPGQKDSDLHRCYIPAESLTRDFIKGKITADKIVVTGIPVRQEFFVRQPKAEAMKKLGLPGDDKHIVMMSGSMGCGPMGELAGMLAGMLPEHCHVTIVCGTNEKLRRELSETLAAYPNMHVKGYVKDISTLMDSADLYLTKPGGISITEAAVKHLPMVLIHAVAGCEEYNRDFFVNAGGAAAAETPAELAQICAELLANDEKRREMAKNLESLAIGDGAENIYADIAAFFSFSGA